MNDLFLRTLIGEKTERRPLWVMRQAGRYLPEYRELRKKNTFEEMCASPDLATEVTLQPMERFPLDAAIVFADLMTPVSAMGVSFHFAPGPVVPNPLRDAASIRGLRIPDAEEIAPAMYETLKRVKRGLNGRANLIGFAGAPWSIAAYLVEGKGGKGFPFLRALLAEDEILFGELLNTLTTLCLEFSIEQYESGADVIQIFDSWAGLLSVKTYTDHVEPHLIRLLSGLREKGIPTIYFAQGAPHLTHLTQNLPCDGLGLCWRSDMAAVRKSIPTTGEGRKALQGNIDPAILLAGPEATKRAAEELMRLVPAHGHIMNLGHGIMPEVPIDSMHALVEAVYNEIGVSA